MPLPGVLVAGAAIKGLIGAGQALFSGQKDKQKKADESIANIQTYKASPLVAQNVQQSQQDVGAAMPGEELAAQQIGQSTTQALGAARTRKGGLGSVGSIAAQQQKSLESLATKKAEFKLGAKERLKQARTQMSNELGKQFASEQEKQQLKANIALGALAGAKAQKAAGLRMVGSAVSDLAMSQSGGTGGAGLGSIFKRKSRSQAFGGGGDESTS